MWGTVHREWDEEKEERDRKKQHQDERSGRVFVSRETGRDGQFDGRLIPDALVRSGEIFTGEDECHPMQVYSRLG